MSHSAETRRERVLAGLLRTYERRVAELEAANARLHLELDGSGPATSSNPAHHGLRVHAVWLRQRAERAEAKLPELEAENARLLNDGLAACCDQDWARLLDDAPPEAFMRRWAGAIVGSKLGQWDVPETMAKSLLVAAHRVEKLRQRAERADAELTARCSVYCAKHGVEPFSAKQACPNCLAESLISHPARTA